MRTGKSQMTAAMCEYALHTGQHLLVATSDQAATIRMLSRLLPKGTLFEVIGDSYVRPHRRAALAQTMPTGGASNL